MDVKTEAGIKPANITCSICVATYRRLELLEQLLKSLLDQDIDAAVTFEIVVVDNDHRKSAEIVVRRFMLTADRPLRYFCQPEKNISLARNLAIEKALGRYVVFIDDDEIAPPRWLHHLFTTMRGSDVDGVIGAVMPVFNDETPVWMRNRELFYGRLPETGAFGPKYTSNAIVRASLLKMLDGPFDPAYGISGGEDTHLFDRLEQLGGRFIFCREAFVNEFLPPDRTRIGYLFQRNVKGGNTHARRVIEFSGNRRQWVRFTLAVKAVIYGSISFSGMLVSLPMKLRSVFWMGRFASNVGRMMAVLGIIYKYYRLTPRSSQSCLTSRDQELVVSEKSMSGENHGC